MKSLFAALIVVASGLSFAETWQETSARIDRNLPGWARANCPRCRVVIPNITPRHRVLRIPYRNTFIESDVHELNGEYIRLFSPNLGGHNLSAQHIYNPFRGRDGGRAELDRICKTFGPNWHVKEAQRGSISMGQLSEEKWKEYVSLHQLECTKGLPTYNSLLVMRDAIGNNIRETVNGILDNDRSEGKEVYSGNRGTRQRGSSVSRQ